MKIAIFGGTFDPFTKAHEAIVNKVLDDRLAEEVIIAPTITNWYRDTSDTWLTDRERLDLCYLAGDWINGCRAKQLGCGSVSIWWRDIQRKKAIPEGDLRDKFVKTWHFIDTLSDIMTEHSFNEDDPNEYFVVIGSDQLEFFKKWHQWEDILKLAKLVVVNNRNGKKIFSDIPHIDLEIGSKFQGVSATDIRKMFKDKENGLDQYCKLFQEPPKEEIIQHTPIFDVVSKPDPDGEIGFNPVGINSPDWVTVFAKKDDKVLMVKQLRYGLMKEFVEFPSGLVDESEDPAHAAERELHEETGIKLANSNDLIYLGKYAANPAFMSNHMHYFFVNLDKAKWTQEEQHLDEHEKLEVSWKSKKEVLAGWFNDASVFGAGMILKLIEHKLIDNNDLDFRK